MKKIWIGIMIALFLFPGTRVSAKTVTEQGGTEGNGSFVAEGTALEETELEETEQGVVEEENQELLEEAPEGAETITEDGEEGLAEETVIFTVSFAVYQEPVFQSRWLGNLGAQEVKVLERAEGGWVKINSLFGDGWVNTDESILHMPYYFKAYSVYETKEVYDVFSPQTLTILERSPEGIVTFKTQNGNRYTKLEDRTMTTVVNPYRAYTYDAMVADIKKLEKMYPEIIQTEIIGKSVEGRDLYAVKLGKGKREMLVAGAHHAREYITSSYCMKTIDTYAKAYMENASFRGVDVKKTLDQTSIYYVPMVNPDGVNLVINGIGATKDPAKVRSAAMLDGGYTAWKANINGVDLNRNYPASLWYTFHNSRKGPSSNGYKGVEPASEPETKAMVHFTEKHDFFILLSMHTKGQVIYWDTPQMRGKVPFSNVYAKQASAVTGYSLVPVNEPPSAYSAGFEDWFRERFLKPGLCVELTPSGNGKAPHNNKNFDALVWNRAGALPLATAAYEIKG